MTGSVHSVPVPYQIFISYYLNQLHDWFENS